MRILIDGVPLLFRSAGVKNYLYYWISALRHLGEAEIKVFPFLGEFAPLDHEGSVTGHLPTMARLGLFAAMNRSGAAAAAILPRADIFHSAKLLEPPRRAKITATLHDVTPWTMPELHTSANVAAERRFAARILSRAAGVIAVSESTRQDAIRVLKLRPELVRTIHHGVEDAFFRAGPAEAANAASRLGLKRPYLLFVGTVEPRKNLEVTLDAWLALPAAVREEFDLVVAGPMGWASARTAERLRATTGVRYLGYVSEAVLPGLFAGAAAFIYVSLYEGFGMPPAQALAAGVPLITSNVSSMPEVAGPAGILVDPRSQSEVASAMERMLGSADLRAQLAARARPWAARFTWPECARRSMEFFRDVAGE
jgi:alpha-1,3-rhamnosyl/mannosyltransferase